MALLSVNMDCEAEEDMNLFSVDVAGDGYILGGVAGEKARAGRHPRWSRTETLILIEGKKAEEAKWSRVKEEREKGIEIGRSANSDSKWLSISQFCKRLAVSRSSSQCRKRWCNLSADYKRIRDWQSLRGKQSFWLMGNDVRKDNKLPSSFDREVYESMDKSMGMMSCSAGAAAQLDIIFDSGRQGLDEGLFSDIEHPLPPEEDQAVSPAKEVESPAIESLTPVQGVYEEKFDDGTFGMDTCEEKLALLPGTRKRRKCPSLDATDDFKTELFTLLEKNMKTLTAHMESQSVNCHLDRIQRKEHADSVVHVLGKVTEALGKIANKL